MRKIVSAAVAALALSVAAPAAAATQIVNSSGILTGATGVVVNGQTYNVELLDTTCAAAFGGCDNAASDFTFNAQGDALLAAQALLTQVFLDTGFGNFDSNPAATLGCETTTGGCLAFIPYSLAGAAPNPVQFAYALNYPNFGNPDSTVANAQGAFDSFLAPSVWMQTGNFNTLAAGTLARFTLASAAVPEPATWAMMLLGFGGIGFQMRRKRPAFLSQIA